MLLAVAYLPLPLGFIAWFALARPLAILFRLETREAFKAAYFFFFMANLFHLYWVAVVTPPGMVAAVVILSLYPAVIIAAAVRLAAVKKILGPLALPVLWVGMEYFRSLTEFAFPWTDLAYSQGYYLTFIQIVSVIGIGGLSLFIMIMNILVWQTFLKNNRLETRVSTAIAFIGLTAAIYIYGWIVMPPVHEEGDIRVSLLQGNVDLETKWKPETRDLNFVLYDSLARSVSDDSVDLIVWPETAAPTYPRHELKYFRMLAETARRSAAPNLVGALDVVASDGKEKSYNSAFQIMPEGYISHVFHKVKLVPFSEHAPYQDYMPFLTRDFLARYLDIIKTREVQWWADFYPGDSIVIFDIDQSRYAVLICFEAAFPDFVRQCVLKGARFLVNITNDTWFGRSPGPFQHMRIAVFRAVENRIWVARCANSGISAFIDPYGRERARAGLYSQKVLTGNLYPIRDYPLFTRLGPVVGRYSFYIMLMTLALLTFRWGYRRIIGR